MSLVPLSPHPESRVDVLEDGIITINGTKMAEIEKSHQIPWDKDQVTILTNYTRSTDEHRAKYIETLESDPFTFEELRADFMSDKTIQERLWGPLGLGDLASPAFRRLHTVINDLIARKVFAIFESMVIVDVAKHKEKKYQVQQQQQQQEKLQQRQQQQQQQLQRKEREDNLRKLHPTPQSLGNSFTMPSSTSFRASPSNSGTFGSASARPSQHPAPTAMSSYPPKARPINFSNVAKATTTTVPPSTFGTNNSEISNFKKASVSTPSEEEYDGLECVRFSAGTQKQEFTDHVYDDPSLNNCKNDEPFRYGSTFDTMMMTGASSALPTFLSKPNPTAHSFSHPPSPSPRSGSSNLPLTNHETTAETKDTDPENVLQLYKDDYSHNPAEGQRAIRVLKEKMKAVKLAMVESAKRAKESEMGMGAELGAGK